MRLLSALVLLAAPLALGQPGINPTQNLVQFGVRETPTAQTDVITIGASACGTSRIVYWVWNQFGVQPCNNMRVWATSQESCGTEPKSAAQAATGGCGTGCGCRSKAAAGGNATPSQAH